MLKKRIKRLIKAWHNCLHLDTLIAQNNDFFDAMWKQHHDAVKQRYELFFVQSKESGVSKDNYGNNLLIVSLTSYGQRIHNVYLTIESIMQQTMKPNKIILWLDKEEFNPDTIPVSLLKHQKRGLEIKYTEDIKSYKKLVPALVEYPEDTIITIDDDCIYPINFIDILYKQHIEHPKDIVCTHAHIIEFEEGGNLKPYIEWIDPPKDISRSSLSFLPIGVGGVLYPPHCMHSDVINKEVFMSLAPMADDMWFKIMSLRNHTMCRTAPIYSDLFDWITTTNGKFDTALCSTNITFNNIQLKSLLLMYNLNQYDFDVYEKTSERIIPELYEESIEQWVLFLKHKYAYEIAKSKIKEGMKILEIGCGDGYGADIISSSGATIVAIDVDQSSIGYAKKKYCKSNICFDCYDGKTIDWPDYSFDMIISFQVIEHVDDVKLYLENIKRLLKPNGLFIITTPNRTYRLTSNQKPWNEFHLREYDLHSLKEEMEIVFPKTCNYYSVSANDEILLIEKERCRPNRSDYDEKEYHFVFKRANYVSYYSTKDFFLVQKEIDLGLDLLVSNKTLI